MIKENHLMPFFEQAGLDGTDLIFIKEMICDEINGSANDQIWPYQGRGMEKSFLYEVREYLSRDKR